MRGILFSKWVLVAALGVAYGTVGLGCGHEHHDDGYNQAAYHDRAYDQDRRDYDDHGHSTYYYHDYDRGRY